MVFVRIIKLFRYLFIHSYLFFFPCYNYYYFSLVSSPAIQLPDSRVLGHFVLHRLQLRLVRSYSVSPHSFRIPWPPRISSSSRPSPAPFLVLLCRRCCSGMLATWFGFQTMVGWAGWGGMAPSRAASLREVLDRSVALPRGRRRGRWMSLVVAWWGHVPIG